MKILLYNLYLVIVTQPFAILSLVQLQGFKPIIPVVDVSKQVDKFEVLTQHTIILTMKKLNIDRAFLQIGELGPIQIRYCLLLCLLNAFAPQIMLQYTYVGQSMEFQCVVNNQTILRNSCPSNEKSTCSSIEFDTKVKDSIESEWNLICEDASWSPSTMSIFMAGVMMGSLTLGSLSDFAGRKKTLILSLFMV